MLRSTLVVFLLVFSVSASAESFDYNYLSLGYGTIEIDNTSADGDGLLLGGSFALNDEFHVFAGYQDAGLDFGVDFNALNVGIGYHMGLSPTVDLVAGVSYQYVEIDVGGFGNADDDGFGLGLGLRFAATPEVELNAGVSYVDLGNSGDDTAFTLGGLYNFSDALALGLSGSWADDISSYMLTGRVYFGR